MAKRDELHLEGEGVKRYDRLRKYLGLIYLYGCFNAQTLGKLNDRTAKDYYAVKALVQDLFGLEEEDDTNPNFAPRILRKYDASAQNRMADSYMMFSVDRVSLLMQYLRLLHRLQMGQASVAELKDCLQNDFNIQGAIDQNTRNRMLEMVQYGYAEKLEKAQYRLVSDGLCDLSTEQLQELYTYVCFASSVTYPRVPGSFLRRTVERVLRSKGAQIPDSSPFILRNNSNHNVFDEEVVFRLLYMIQRRQAILIDGQEYLPVKLRIDCHLGRWYVLMAGEYRGQLQPVIRAVSRLELPTPSGSGNDPRWEDAAALVDTYYKDEESLFSGVQRETSVLVEAKLHFGEEIGRQEQFCRELRIGSIESAEDGLYYRAYIRDPLDLLPLLRTYSPWLEVLPGEHDLQERMADTLQQMVQNLDARCWPALKENRRTFEKRTGGKVTEEKKSKKESEKDEEQKLLNPFQGRMLQFCLDLLADPAKDGTDTTYVSAIAKRYGILNWRRTVELLREAGFFEKNSPRPRLPMSLMEREYLQYILDPKHMPEVALFLSEQTRQALTDTLPAWIEHIQWKKAPGMQLPQYPGPEGFRDIIKAIRERRMIAYRYRVRDKEGEQTAVCLPWKLEYSAYDRRWWVILYVPKDNSTVKKDERTVKATLNNLRDVHILSESLVPDQKISSAMETLRMKKPVELHIRDEHNALQRCFTVFENQEVIGSSYSPETGYVLQLHAFAFDREEILRQLMYLGPNVHLEGPEDLRENLRSRLKNAQRYNSIPKSVDSTEI